jgi:hypothetical protein
MYIYRMTRAHTEEIEYVKRSEQDKHTRIMIASQRAFKQTLEAVLQARTKAMPHSTN